MRFPRFLIAIAATCCLFFTTADCFSAGKWFNRNALTGGGANALDGVSGSSDGMDNTDSKALVITPDAVYYYDLDLTSGATESVPNIISPDTAAGTKRWILINSFARIIAEDTIFYVATTGSDTTGNGTAGAPWASLGRAMDYLSGFYWDTRTVDVTVQLADGSYTSLAAPISLHHPCGQSLFIQGDTGADRSWAITGTNDKAGTDEITVGSDVTNYVGVGDVIFLLQGTNIGAWSVASISYSAPSTTIALNEDLLDDAEGAGGTVYWPRDNNVVLSFNSGVGGLMLSNGSVLGGLTGVHLKGSGINNKGVFVDNSSFLNAENGIVASGFQYAVYLDGSSTAIMKECEFVGGGVSVSGSSYCDVSGTHVGHSWSTAGFSARENSQIKAGGGTAATGNTGSGYDISSGSFLYCGIVYALGNTLYGFDADYGGRIDARSAVVADNTVGDYRPAASLADVPNFGEVGGWIIGGTETDNRVDGPLFVSLGSAGADPAWTTTIDALIVESAAANNCTIEIFTAKDKIGNYGFADPDARNIGGVAYNHATDTMSLRAGNTAVMAVSATTVAFIVSPPTYADNATAITGGLAAGDVYRTATGVLMIVY